MVEFITYKEKQLPIKVGYIALKMVKLKTGKNFDQIGDDLEVYETLLYWSLKQGAAATEKDFVFTEDQMADILDDCFFEFVEKIPLFFPDIKKAMAQIPNSVK